MNSSAEGVPRAPASVAELLASLDRIDGTLPKRLKQCAICLRANLDRVAVSTVADMAQLAERAVGDLKVCQYMEPHIGEKLDAKIIRVAKPGITVHLTDYNVSGFLPSRSIGDRAYVKGSTLEIQAGRRSLSFSEGGAIKVKLDDVDFMKLQLLLTLP